MTEPQPTEGPVCLQQSQQVPGVPGRQCTYLQYGEVYEGRTGSYKVVYRSAVIVFHCGILCYKNNVITESTDSN